MWMMVFLLLPLLGMAYVGWHVWTLVPLPALWRGVLIAVGVASFLLLFLNLGRYIDRMPLGDMAGTVSTIIQCHEAECDFVYRHVFGRGEFTLDTRELREVMEDVPLSTPEVVFWIKENIEENLRELYGGNKYENN